MIGLYRLLKEVREPAKKHAHRERHMKALRESAAGWSLEPNRIIPGVRRPKPRSGT